jgi:hypothetical protein
MIRRLASAAALSASMLAVLVGPGCSRATERPGDSAPTAAGEAPGGPVAESRREVAGAPLAEHADVRIFERVSEPREGAFTMLMPLGWRLEGGIARIDPTAAGGPAQSIEAKLDLSIKRDGVGSVMGRVLPDLRYVDMRYSPAGQMGLFPPGSNYNGMRVMPFPGAAQFIANVAFPYAHPGAQNVTMADSRPAPELAQRIRQSFAGLPLPALPVTDAAVVRFTYDEGGTRYGEVWSGVLVNWGQIAAGMWENRETRFMRAPEAEFDRWLPTFAAMQASLQVNPRWLAGEIQGQITRGQIMIDTQQQVQRIEQQIIENRQKINAEIQNSMYLNLTGQEDYKNPFTGEYETRPVELGRYRWVNDLGQEIYSGRDDYDPNVDINVYHKGFKRSVPRQ